MISHEGISGPSELSCLRTLPAFAKKFLKTISRSWSLKSLFFRSKQFLRYTLQCSAVPIFLIGNRYSLIILDILLVSIYFASKLIIQWLTWYRLVYPKIIFTTSFADQKIRMVLKSALLNFNDTCIIFITCSSTSRIHITFLKPWKVRVLAASLIWIESFCTL